eukprot:333727_1
MRWINGANIRNVNMCSPDTCILNLMANDTDLDHDLVVNGLVIRTTPRLYRGCIPLLRPEMNNHGCWFVSSAKDIYYNNVHMHLKLPDPNLARLIFSSFTSSCVN